ncbi:MAG TPA: serine hydrolase domain-containing protein [Gammaproteobacteria bacterium]
MSSRRAPSAERLRVEDILERLEAAFAGVQRKHVVVAVSGPSGRRYAAASCRHGVDREPGEWRFAAGCVTKLLTAALVLDAVEAGAVRLDDGAASLLGGADARSRVTVRHLLEHTHGIADPPVSRAPLREDGRIDAAALLASVGDRTRWPAGALYSYSDVGPWLAAAIAERLWGAPFADLLRERLSLDLGAATQPDGAPPLACASRGGGVALRVRDLIGFLERALAGAAFQGGRDDLTPRITPLPGWSVAERGIYLGWKYFGDGWFGHNSVVPSASLLVRLHPQSRLGLLIASRDHPASLVAAKLFARSLPELNNLVIPKPLDAEHAAALDLTRYCGTYGTGRWRLSIDLLGRTLVLRGEGFRAALVPAGGELFFTRPPTQGQPAYVQLLHGRPEGFRYLWDGQQLLDNLGVRDSLPGIAPDAGALAPRSGCGQR